MHTDTNTRARSLALCRVHFLALVSVSASAPLLSYRMNEYQLAHLSVMLK